MNILMHIVNIKKDMEEYLVVITHLESSNIVNIKDILLSAIKQQIDSMNVACQLCKGLLKDDVDTPHLGEEDTKLHCEDIKLDIDDIASKLDIAEHDKDVDQPLLEVNCVKEEDVVEECNKHGGVQHIYVDKASSQVRFDK